MKQDAKTNAQIRLKRIAGQVAGVHRMVDEDRPYAEILLQLAAAQAALMETARTILWSSAEDALSRAMDDPDPQRRRRQLDELLDLLTRFFDVREGER